MSEVDYLAFATGVSANVQSQAAYAASATTGTGFESGLAISENLNKVWRQSSMISAAVANFIANQLSENVLDDGNLTNLINQLTSAINAAAAATAKPARVYTANTTLSVLAVSDYAVGIKMTSPLSGLVIDLDNLTAIGQSFVIEDLGQQFQSYPPVVTLPGSGVFPNGAGTFIMNRNGQSNEFRKYSATQWSVR